MAIDTRDKRFSMMNLGGLFPEILPIPSGSFDAADRAQILWLYARAAIVVQPTPSIRIANVLAESRIATPPTEDRIAVVPVEDRTSSI